jgi:aryl-alcohol dehydrogenase-like predicted oxidoreductase
MQALAERCTLRLLGDSDLALSPVGFGAWALGGDGWRYSLGAQDDRESIAAIHCALDLGINWIDTAGVYGLGRSEKVVARALRSSPHKAQLFTKISVRWREDGSLYNCLRSESLTEEVEGSLRRLGVEAIDLVQVHWPEPDADIEEGWETLARLREQGKIRWIGVSNFSVAQMRRAMRIAPITSLQPNYSMLRRKAEADVLPFARANGIGVINYAPMGSGLLTGNLDARRIAALPLDDCRRTMAQFHEPRLSRNLRLVELLREIGRGHSVSAGAVAVAWTLHHPAITGSIVGFRSVREVEEIAAALHFRLSEDEYREVNGFLTSIRWYLDTLYARFTDAAPVSGQRLRTGAALAYGSTSTPAVSKG